MAREILDNGQIKLSDERIINPLYWDEVSSGWNEYDFSELDMSEGDIAWVESNLTEEDKENYRQVFSVQANELS